VYHKEEILLAQIDLSAVSAARLDFDPCGHYSRPDLFELKIK
jgi:nitrilase